MLIVWCFFFFFKQKTAYEMRISDWSSDVCSSDLLAGQPGDGAVVEHLGAERACQRQPVTERSDIVVEFGQARRLGNAMAAPQQLAGADDGTVAPHAIEGIGTEGGVARQARKSDVSGKRVLGRIGPGCGGTLSKNK